MFLKVKQVDTDLFPKIVTINTDQIIYYFSFGKDTTMIHFSDNTGLKAYITEEELDDILVYKNCDPTPVKEIDDNPLNFSTDPEPISEPNKEDRLATSKQIAYIRSIAKKKGLDLTLPKTITFEFARKFLDKYAPKKKKQTSEFDWEQLDEDADGEFPGYRD